MNEIWVWFQRASSMAGTEIEDVKETEKYGQYVIRASSAIPHLSTLCHLKMASAIQASTYDLKLLTAKDPLELLEEYRGIHLWWLNSHFKIKVAATYWIPTLYPFSLILTILEACFTGKKSKLQGVLCKLHKLTQCHSRRAAKLEFNAGSSHNFTPLKQEQACPVLALLMFFSVAQATLFPGCLFWDQLLPHFCILSCW